MFKITCSVDKFVNLSEIVPFQHEMKTLSDINYQKLKREIQEMGFSFAVHVWKEKDKIYCLDGHQRVECVKRMAAENCHIEEIKIPVVFVQADSLKDAKRKCMAAASQYGEFNLIGVEKMLEDLQMPATDAATHFDFPKIDLENIVKELKNSFKELDESEFSEFQHKCPKCNFEFNDKK